MKIPKTNYAFIDGSFNKKTSTYGYGGFLIDSFGVKHIIQGRGDDPDAAKLRNVAGEIMGAMAVIRKVVELGMHTITIFYDYDGIAKWPTESWQTKNNYTIAYKKFMRSMVVKHGLKIIFTHVKGHSGIEGNEEADRLAKEAVGLSA